MRKKYLIIPLAAFAALGLSASTLTVSGAVKITSDQATIEANSMDGLGTYKLGNLLNIDFSDVNILKEGVYDIALSYNGETVFTTLTVTDDLNQEFAKSAEAIPARIGDVIKLSDIHHAVSDDMTVCTMAFKDGSSSFTFDKTGEIQKTIILTDSQNHKNEMDVTFEVLDKVMCATKNLNVRDEASSYDGEIIGTYKKGQAVHVVGYHVDNGWYEVESKGKRGWVMGYYLNELSDGNDSQCDVWEDYISEENSFSLYNYSREVSSIRVTCYNSDISLRVGDALTVRMLELQYAEDCDVSVSFAPDLSIRSKKYDTKGVYNETVYITDKSTGNMKTLPVTVTVEEAKSLSIEVNGDIKVKQVVWTGKKFNKYVFDGNDVVKLEKVLKDNIKAYDDHGKNITSKVKISKYDINKYDKKQKITYTVTDSEGKTAKATCNLYIESTIKKMDTYRYMLISDTYRNLVPWSQGEYTGERWWLFYQDKVHVIGQHKISKMYLVEKDGKRGWVKGEYLLKKPRPDNEYLELSSPGGRSYVKHDSECISSITKYKQNFPSDCFCTDKERVRLSMTYSVGYWDYTYKERIIPPREK